MYSAERKKLFIIKNINVKQPVKMRLTANKKVTTDQGRRQESIVFVFLQPVFL